MFKNSELVFANNFATAIRSLSESVAIRRLIRDERLTLLFQQWSWRDSRRSIRRWKRCPPLRSLSEGPSRA